MPLLRFLRPQFQALTSRRLTTGNASRDKNVELCSALLPIRSLHCPPAVTISSLRGSPTSPSDNSASCFSSLPRNSRSTNSSLETCIYTSSPSAPTRHHETSWDLANTWTHATRLYHTDQYTSALISFHSLLSHPVVTAQHLPRLYLNIGLILLALRASYPAAEAFYKATTLLPDESSILKPCPADGLALIAVFLLGIAAWELGTIENAQLCFDVCAEMFDGDVVFDFASAGLDFTLAESQVRWNSKECEKRMELRRRMPMRTGFEWPLHRIPTGLLFGMDMVDEEGENETVTRPQKGGGNAVGKIGRDGVNVVEHRDVAIKGDEVYTITLRHEEQKAEDVRIGRRRLGLDKPLPPLPGLRVKGVEDIELGMAMWLE